MEGGVYMWVFLYVGISWSPQNLWLLVRKEEEGLNTGNFPHLSSR